MFFPAFLRTDGKDCYATHTLFVSSDSCMCIGTVSFMSMILIPRPIPAYSLGQLLFGWELRRNWIEGSVFLGITNLFDAQYNANTRVNAALGRYYEPGPPLNLFGGIRMRIVVY